METSTKIYCRLLIIGVLYLVYLIDYHRFYVVFSYRGGAVLAYHIHRLKRRFSSLLSDAAIERENEKVGCYIAVPQAGVEAEIQGMISKFLSFEQLMETLMKGPKSFGHDSNPWHLLRTLKSELHSQEHVSALKTLATTNYNGKLKIKLVLINAHHVLLLFSGSISANSSGM